MTTKLTIEQAEMKIENAAAQHMANVKEIIDSIGGMHGNKAAAVVEVSANFDSTLAMILPLLGMHGVSSKIMTAITDKFLFALDTALMLMCDGMTEMQKKAVMEFSDAMQKRCADHAIHMLDIAACVEI